MRLAACPSGAYPIVTEADRRQQDAAPPGACRTIPNGAPCGMADASNPFRSRTRDTKVMFAVTYSDGRSAYIRVDPETARHGNMIVMDIARERQEAGELPDGTIVSVKQVR